MQPIRTMPTNIGSSASFVGPTNTSRLLEETNSNWTNSNWTSLNGTGSNWTSSNWTSSAGSSNLTVYISTILASISPSSDPTNRSVATVSIDDDRHGASAARWMTVIAVLTLVVLGGMMFTICRLVIKAEAVRKCGLPSFHDSLLFSTDAVSPFQTLIFQKNATGFNWPWRGSA